MNRILYDNLSVEIDHNILMRDIDEFIIDNDIHDVILPKLSHNYYHVGTFIIKPKRRDI